MTIYRITKRSSSGKRIATKVGYDRKVDAQRYAKETAYDDPGSSPRVVKDSERVRRMIP
jgi:hypothetical protein